MGHSDCQVPPGTGSGAARCRARVRPKHAQCKVRAPTRHHAISIPYLVFVCCGATCYSCACHHPARGTWGVGRMKADMTVTPAYSTRCTVLAVLVGAVHDRDPSRHGTGCARFFGTRCLPAAPGPSGECGLEALYGNSLEVRSAYLGHKRKLTRDIW